MVQRRKILYVDTGADFLGGQRSLFDLANRLDRTRYEIIIAIPFNSDTRVHFEKLAEIRVFPASSASGANRINPINIILSIYTFSKLVREIRPDIIHANTFLAGLILSLIPSLRIPWILHQRDLTDHGKLSDWVARKATKVIAVSGAAADHFKRTVTDDELSVIPDGVSFSFLELTDESESNPNLRKKLGIEENTLIIGTVGTISEQKSQHEILHAANRLRDIPGIHFLIIGDPYRENDVAYYERLKEIRKELNLEELVTFIGYTDDLAGIYGSINILAHPANREGFGRVIIEAMAAGIPVLAKDCSGPAEIISNGVDGILCDPNDPDDFAEELRKLIENDGFRRKLAGAAKQKAVNEYALEVYTHRIEQLYEELIATNT